MNRFLNRKALNLIAAALTASLVFTACSSPAADLVNVSQRQSEYDLGINFLSDGNYEEAIAAFELAITADSTLPEAYFRLSEIYVELQNPEYAAQVLYTGWANCPGNEEEFSSLLAALGYTIGSDGVLTLTQASEAAEAEAAYQEMISFFRTGVSKRWANTDVTNLTEAEQAISYLWYTYPLDALSEAGYLIEDLNSDGIPELAVSTFASAESGMVYDLYTYRNGEVVHLLSSAERNRFYLCEEEFIANEGSSGAADSTRCFYTLHTENNDFLVLQEVVRYYGMDDPESPWYYSTSETYDISLMTHISEAEAMAVLGSYTYRSLTLTPLAQNAPATEDTGDILLPETETLLPVDYVGKTVSELASIWGNDFVYADYWLAGAAKAIYYTDSRTSLMFYYIDQELLSNAQGDEFITLVYCSPTGEEDFSEIAPGIPLLATYTQLSSLGYETYLYSQEENLLQEFGESDLATLNYSDTIQMHFYWFNDADPYTTPAGIIIISLTPPAPG